ncbi:MAG TPA: hypothetical protein VFK86_16305 [Bauldia sp.]|nr:hypothetical protein [Bauldia sp.]
MPLRTARRPSLGLVLLALALILVLAGVAWAINNAIDRYHDRVALKGLDGKPSPVALTVGTEPMVVPANLIRFPKDRRGGLVTAVDLLLLWPSLDGFSEERAEAFRDGASQAPLIFVTISEAETPLDSTTRLNDLYSRYFTGPALPGPGHLVGHAMAADSPWRGEIVYFEPGSEEPYVVRCLASETELIPATCIREINIGRGLTMLYRFNRAWLADWRMMDDRVRRLVTQFFPRA